LYSMFQSVTPRTAGFNTYDYGKMSEGGLLVTIVLMLIGGAPGSTAGGMKVTTVFLLLLTCISNLRRREEVNCFRRRMDHSVIQNAFSIWMIYVMLLLAGTGMIASEDSIPIIHSMFECASALGTVGLTVGITSTLSSMSKIILITFMYFGRVGGLTIAYAALSTRKKPFKKYPMEKIAVG
ncbi:MAG: TrkH family potassium uptake protein, partial [Solobacterium sp.]|nr:TrkH family potassium uptake protein [Solobacterium sp.]